MIQRISELDRYSKEDFRNDYLDNREEVGGETNPHYGNFKSESFLDNLSDTMLFEISLGRPMDSNGALDDSVQDEAVSYYKSFKAGGDVIAALISASIKNYFTKNVVEFGTPGDPEDCPPASALVRVAGVKLRRDSTATPVKVHNLWNSSVSAHILTHDEAEIQNLIATGWVEADGGFFAWKTAVDNTVPIYRFKRKSNGKHHYVASGTTEFSAMDKATDTWIKEGVAFYAYAGYLADTQQVYRYSSPDYNSHFFTTNPAPTILMQANPHWKFEGPSFWVPLGEGAYTGAGRKPVYKLRKPDQGTVERFLTIDEAEKTSFLNSGWQLDGESGISFYAYDGPLDVPQLIPVYRFRSISNPACKAYITNPAEVENLNKNNQNWALDGIAFYVFHQNSANGTPVYRFFSQVSGKPFHYYSASETELNNILVNYRSSWKFEGCDFKALPGPNWERQSVPSEAVPVYRFVRKGDIVHHFYTTNPNEANNVRSSSDWEDEGFGFQALSTQLTDEHVPVARLIKNHIHFYSYDSAEIQKFKNADWEEESGSAFYCLPISSKRGEPVFRFHSTTGSGGYFYTINIDELNNTLKNPNWECEGSTMTLYRNEPVIVDVHRFMNKDDSGENTHHFYTIHPTEVEIFQNDPKWKDEGIEYKAYTAEIEGLTTPVYRFRTTDVDNKFVYFFTASRTEKDTLIAENPSWNYEGIAFHAYKPGLGYGVPVYRFYSNKYKGHFYCATEAEKDYVINNNPNWVYEGVCFNAIPAGYEPPTPTPTPSPDDPIDPDDPEDPDDPYYPDDPDSPSGPRDAHVRRPDKTTPPVNVYCGMTHHSPVIMHNWVEFHDNIFAHGTISAASNNVKIRFPGMWNEGDEWYFGADIHGCCLSAKWADVAEMYEADDKYEPGTLLEFGGDKEVTVARRSANAVVTSKPGVVLNSPDVSHDGSMVGVALTGRTPIRVVGKVRRFDRLCLSRTPGVARAKGLLDFFRKTIAVALEGSDEKGEKLVVGATRLSL